MLYAVLPLFAAGAIAQKACLDDWARDVTDSCALYSELTECQTRLSFCAAGPIVMIENIDNVRMPKMLEEATFANLEAAVADAGISATDFTIQVEYTYAGSTGTLDITDDASLKIALALDDEPIFKATYAPIDGWKEAGTLADWNTVTANYPPASYIYGTIYNHGGTNVIHKVVPSSWNRGIRLTTENYMQKDDVEEFDYGVAVFYRGLNDDVGGTDWTHRYYQMRGGAYRQQWSNGNANGVRLFVKKRANDWILAGTVNDFDTVIADYPPSRFAMGVRYNSANGYIHDVVLSGWNLGVRMTTEKYMMGDNGEALMYGMVVLARGTRGQTHDWQHHYYRLQGGSYTEYSSNGSGAAKQVWVRKL